MRAVLSGIRANSMARRGALQRSFAATSTDQPSASSEKLVKPKVLVLGGNGFVGRTISRQAIDQGWKVVSLSRSGAPSDASRVVSGVDYRLGNAAEPGAVAGVLAEGGYTGVVHAIGILFEGDVNKYVSGSGAIAGPGETYDTVTRQTAVNAADAFADASKGVEPPPPFVFVSAAEAGWEKNPPWPLDWLARYLDAKRAVESRLMTLNEEQRLRTVILRPSLIWSWSQTPFEKALKLPPVGIFSVANKLGIPGVDMPIRVETLASAAMRSLQDPDVNGVQRQPQMEELAKKQLAGSLK